MLFDPFLPDVVVANDDLRLVVHYRGRGLGGPKDGGFADVIQEPLRLKRKVGKENNPPSLGKRRGREGCI